MTYIHLLAFGYIQASEQIAYPKTRFTTSYTIDFPPQKLYPNATHFFHRETEDHFFVTYPFGDESHIVRLEKKHSSGSPNGVRDGESLIILRQLHISFDKGYHLFSPDKPMEVLAHKKGKVQVKTHRPIVKVLSLPEKYFTIKTKTKREASKRVTTASPTRTKKILLSSNAKSTVSENSRSEAALKSEMEKLKAALKLKQIRPVRKMQDAICFIRSDTGGGTGFLFFYEGNLYCYTNQHVIAKGGDFEITTLAGDTITSVFYEVAEDRDLARILIKEELPTLYQYTIPEVEDVVWVFGNSDGAGFITKEKGKVVGLSPTEFEVTCEFVPGNSGSPLVDRKGIVYGVATRAEKASESWVRESTRYANTRRFATRLAEDITWIPIDLKRMQASSVLVFEESSFIRQVLVLMTILARNPYTKVVTDSHYDPKLALWAKRRNADIKQYLHQYNSDQSRENLSTLVNSLRSQALSHQRYLLKMLNAHKSRISRTTLYPNNSHNRAALQELQDDFESAHDAMEYLSELVKERVPESF